MKVSLPWKKKKVNEESERKVFSTVMMGIIILVGVIFVIIGTVVWFNQYDLTHEESTTGTVIANMETTDDPVKYIPTYEYYVNNVSYTIQDDYESTTLTPVGTTATIYFKADDPASGVVYSFDNNVLWIVVGLMAITLPLALYIIDSDSQRDDELAGEKAEFVVFLGILFYFLIGGLVGDISFKAIWANGPALVIISACFVLAGVYSLLGVLKLKKAHK